ncbi:MAG: ATP-dependent RNA helicase DbpA [Paludibacterium sp.]|uniref:ATP-dependent RNA helicase DbpA n=1 Tax=Paludibacterium sp. TaxID=1917523 RepID=UPI002600114A|nr:ATP-dependent RNA helicase DbpA [Paludibacterium sp.]MBV8048195.1 ATP-dependent RNA helicase DbpA [Paludibacterium sp.]MBV8647210.1 ATP-dependent RNA helicase DbpA [Paludibacterium sp.]
MNKTAFSALALSGPMLANLESLGYQSMTPIQAESLPATLANRDLIAQAKTGSGKTAAFGIPLMEKINPRWFAIQGLVLCPTRELAEQVAKELRRLARHIDNIKVLTLCGGSPMGPQIGSLEHGAHVVVGTPGRLRDHLGRGTIDLSTVHTLVLDEADRMVDMGFFEDIAGIVSACPKKRQTLLFSATYPDNIRKLSAPFLRAPLEVKVESLHAASQIEQRFYKIDAGARNDTVAKALLHFRPTSTLAFCNTKIHCRELAAALTDQGFAALALYGELEQRERDEILLRFVNRSVSVLVATDVAARGLDIQALDMVINVDVARDAEVHVHRIGRTGRGDQQGIALTLAAAADQRWVDEIARYQQAPAVWHDSATLTAKGAGRLTPPMVTVCIAAGKKEKLRPGDILGALTGDGGLDGQTIGKIQIGEFTSYVALQRDVAEKHFSRLTACPIKGKARKMRLM